MQASRARICYRADGPEHAARASHVIAETVSRSMHHHADEKGMACGGEILCVTNRKLCREDFFEHMESVAQALHGRSGGIILREKDLSEEEYRELAGKIMKICGKYGVRCILHNFADTAAALGAQAIHLPLPVLRRMHGSASAENRERSVPACNAMDAASAENGEEPVRSSGMTDDAANVISAKNGFDSHQGTDPEADARSILSRFRIIGASCHSVEDALEAQALGCTYITAGHIFATDCKKGVPPRGLAFLREVCRSVSIPVYAIGGINEKNYLQVLQTGAAGACIMSGLMCCESAEEYLRGFMG